MHKALAVGLLSFWVYVYALLAKLLIVNLLKLSTYRTNLCKTLKPGIKDITHILIIVFVFILFYIVELIACAHKK